MSDDFLIKMPQLGLTMTEGMLVEWSVAPGQSVNAGDLLYIVETDKIANEILADRDGVLGQVFVNADETVPVGTTLGIWDGGESPSDPGVTLSASEPVESAPKPSSPTPSSKAQAPSSGARIIATPHARKLARGYDVDLRGVTGSGPKGRIVARDVEQSHLHGTPTSSGSSQPLRGSRKVVAERMLRSQQQIPHFYLTANAEVSELLWLHEGLKQKPGLEHVTLTHWIATAMGLVLAKDPLFRTTCENDMLTVLPQSDVGIAVATKSGLFAPVARNLGAHGLAENASQIAALVIAGREGRLSGESMRGGATTVSNLGGYDIEQVFPLINPGQSSILGVGRQQSIFRPDDAGEPKLMRELGLVLACDHRVFNGADGARMLQSIVRLLEDPLLVIAAARE